MTLGEVVNPRAEKGDLNGCAGAGPPDPGIDEAQISGR